MDFFLLLSNPLLTFLFFFSSLRKFATTYCCQRGCSQQEVEIRGRWKGRRNGSVVNRYINPDQLPTDAKVAGVLCMGGPVFYRLKEDSHVTPEFMRTHVVPGISNFFSNGKLPVLGMTLLSVVILLVG